MKIPTNFQIVSGAEWDILNCENLDSYSFIRILTYRSWDTYCAMSAPSPLCTAFMSGSTAHRAVGWLIINYLIMYLACQNNCELWYFILLSNDKVTASTKGFFLWNNQKCWVLFSLFILPEVWEKVQTINNKSKKDF